MLFIPLFSPQDYPSVGQLAQVLSANNIQSIFAVTEKIYPTYQVGMISMEICQLAR